jgi:hypothetical protein
MDAHPVVPNDPDGTHADFTGFEIWIMWFIDSHSVDADCHELLDFIWHSIKPRKMNMQAYYICLRELNNMVEWLPGAEEKLTESQLDQAFYDAMPEVWTARYTNAGHSLRTDSHSEMMHFFCTQQANADRVDFRNESKMKAERKKNKDFDSSKPRARKKWRADAKHRLSHQEKKEHNRSSKTKSET